MIGKRGIRAPWFGDLLVLLGIVAVTAVIHFFVVNQRAFLNFYYLPVVFAAYLLGLRKGVLAALLACSIVFAVAVTNDSQFLAVDREGWMRWFDLGIWGCFLVLVSYVVGSLNEERALQLGNLREAYRGILEIMSKLIDSIDRSTENHSKRVAERSVEVARAFGMSEAEIEDVRVGAYLHDIGKVDVSVAVLRKAGGLDEDERAEMERHVDHGERLVGTMGGILRHAIPMIAYHHERWDGEGYKGLVGEEIPMGARIIAVADTYDAIVHDRPYRERRTHDEAIAILRAESGRQFDPRVVETFVRLYDLPDTSDQRKAA
jgi:putative nucleotidyltransferase with HDIG domain